MSNKVDKPERRAPRFPIQIRLDKDSLGLFTDSMIMNISKGGIFLHVPNPQPVGTTLELEFMLPGLDGKKEHHMKVAGEVVWALDYNAITHPSLLHPGMGIRFTQISEKDKKAMLAYIEHLQNE